MRIAPASLALVALLSPSLPAQERSTPRFYVAGGVELGTSLGLSFQAGYFRQLSRLGLRLGGAYYERGGESSPTIFFPGRASDWRTVAATFDLTYDLTATSTRPYLIGGGSVYRSSTSIRYDNDERARYARIGVAPFLGAGLRFPLGTAEAFSELRVHFGRSLPDTRVGLPLTFGIRF